MFHVIGHSFYGSMSWSCGKWLSCFLTAHQHN